MSRFHEEIPGMSLLYHGYCSDHPEFEEGRCGPEQEIAGDVMEHNRVMHGMAPVPSDGEVEQ